MDKVRKCYFCKRIMHISQISKYDPKITSKDLKRIWDNDNIEILCCGCYPIAVPIINFIIRKNKKELKNEGKT